MLIWSLLAVSAASSISAGFFEPARETVCPLHRCMTFHDCLSDISSVRHLPLCLCVHSQALKGNQFVNEKSISKIMSLVDLNQDGKVGVVHLPPLWGELCLSQ